MEEEDELDELLETMLKKSDTSSGKECDSAGVPEAEIPSLGITFSFPGWGAEIFQDQKRRVSENRDETAQSSTKLNWPRLEGPTSGSPISKLPEEQLTRIFTFLTIKDLSVSRQVSKHWYALCSSDYLWERFIVNPNPETSSPRWLEHKHGALLLLGSRRVSYFTHNYASLVQALDAWWEHGQPHGIYSSSKLCPLIREFTARDWCGFYELLSAVFANRAESLSASLLRKLHGRSNLYDLEGVRLDDGVAGMKIWELLRDYWQRYIAWVKLVFLHCSDLNCLVRMERCRSLALGFTCATRYCSAVQTPTLYDKGVICFRSQVLLSYGLRAALQAGLSRLSAKETEGTASEQDVELLCALHHLLQELDVADDSTLRYYTFTQVKFRRCFLDGESSKDYSKAQILAARKEYF